MKFLEAFYTPAPGMIDQELAEALNRRDVALREYEFYRKLDIDAFSERAKPQIIAAHQHALERYLSAGQEYRRLMEMVARGQTA